MVVLAIMGILVAIAWPAYQKHFIRVARTDAQAQMMDIAIRQEQFMLADRAYADKTTLEASGYTLPTKVAAKYTYNITLGAGTVPTFLITFTPYASQVSDVVLTLNNEGAKTPADKW